MSFNGFSHRTVDFLVENRVQNSREWFEAHRAEYNELVLEPLRELVRALTPTMLKIDPQLTVEPAVNKTISRIYRDTRFSRDKSLFRDEMWITFMRRKKFWEGLPGYYFIFGPDGLYDGVGYYEASPEAMEGMREMVLRREPAFLAVLEAYEAQTCYRIDAARYKRTKYPEEPERFRAWLDLKNLNFGRRTADFDLLFSPELAKVLAEGFMLLKPMYDFICAVEERKTRGVRP